MPPPRNQPARSSQRRNSLQDVTPTRTRTARGAKSAPSKHEEPEFDLPKPSPTKLSPTTTRKTTRSASNISGRSFETAPEVYASYEEPLLMVFGLSPEFFNGLKKHHGKLPKERKSVVSSLPQLDLSPEEQESDTQSESAESEVEDEPVAHSAPRGRGRGGRGSRGGRGRGGRGRGRGRGGRPRGSLNRASSPVRARMARNTAPRIRLTEEDDDDSTNQDSSNYGAKLDSALNEDELMGEADDSDHDNDNAIADDSGDEDDNALQRGSVSPKSSPQPGPHDSIAVSAPKADTASTIKVTKPLPVPKISLSQSASRTPRDMASTPAESAVPALLRPEDDVLSDSDLPEPFIEGVPIPPEAECEDRADYLLQKRFKPMVDVQEVIATLTKYPVSQRSTESLYALAENTQRILQEWQDQYLMLDARTAPHMHPAKKACNGGRIPMASDVFEAMKEADLYGYTYDAKKLPENQDPWGQRPGAEKSGGRELRTRRNRDMLDSAPASEEEGEEDEEGRPAKRQRRATRKFDGSDAAPGTGTTTPKKHNGWGGARKKGVSRFAKTASETPEPENRPTKRARVAASNLLHQRIQEMREASLVPSSGDEESSAMDADEYSDTNVKRGRPAGSKNTARRSDFGIKKGPRKKPVDADAPVPSAHGPNAPPPALQSMSEGQGQFSLVDPAPLSESAPLVPNSAETVFQATQQPSTAQEVVASQSDMSHTPEAYMSTAPLSQYTNNYVDDGSPAGSRRKPRVKSEKRSQSMTIWWAERKARQREQDEKNGTPSKGPDSRPGSPHSKRGRTSTIGSATGGPASATPSEDPRRPALAYSEHNHQHPPPEPYSLHHNQPPPLTAPSPLYMFAAAPPPPPPHPMLLQYSPLAALPSGSYPFSGPPPLGGSAYGSRALAPAPLQPQQAPSYPSPYGPQSPASRPKSSGQRSGPPPLAPAPSALGQQQHYSPYAPAPVGREQGFKVMVPGPPQPPGGERRGSR